jgi:hypothetical protein
MIGTRVIVATVLAGLALAACDRKAPEPRLAPLAAWEVNGARVWQRITQESDFENWAYWPGHEGLRAGQSPHGKFHEVYINNTLRERLPIESDRAPHGTIIVKENFDAARNPEGLVAMVKVDGYNPQAGDWFWVAYDTTGAVLREGAIAGCISCHAGMKDNDYVILRRLDAPLPVPPAK